MKTILFLFVAVYCQENCKQKKKILFKFIGIKLSTVEYYTRVGRIELFNL